MKYVPDYTNMVAVLANWKPRRLPLYEHIVDPAIMEQILGVRFAACQQGDVNDLQFFFEHYCDFFRKMTYDTVSFEVTVTDLLPGHGAILGGKPGPIQNRQDFRTYPWNELEQIYWQTADRQFSLLRQILPEGMKAIGGIGNGIFEVSEDLVGMEYLAYMQVDDPELFADLYRRIGDLMVGLWTRFLKNYSDIYAVCRIGDDMGYKSGLLISPTTIRTHIIPPYNRVIDLVHSYGKPFLLHCCGCIFEIMDDMIALGIDAKHSNEDQIAPFDRWIELYGNRIGLLGGIDVNLLCLEKPDDIRRKVLEAGKRFRQKANGYALGSGNSIPDYVPVEGYLAMVEAVQHLREQEYQLVE